MLYNKSTLVLLGGVDISSHWYDEPSHPRTQTPDLERDTREFITVQDAIQEGRSVIGVCRGAQLLCVANGGKLHQHVPEHSNNSHPIFTYDDKILYDVAADHHQVMAPAGDYILYATAYRKTNDDEGFDDYTPEVVWWPSTRCLAVQPHPEWMPSSHPFNVWLNDLMKKLNIDWEF